tara:strand:- start:217 stop:372 length:156 start_codon:yes stop_codon:yes gene_type:complete
VNRSEELWEKAWWDRAAHCGAKLRAAFNAKIAECAVKEWWLQQQIVSNACR